MLAGRALLQQLQGSLSDEALTALAAHALVNGLRVESSSSDEDEDEPEERDVAAAAAGPHRRSPAGHTAFSWGFGNGYLCRSPPPASLEALGALLDNGPRRQRASSRPRGHTPYSWPAPEKATVPSAPTPVAAAPASATPAASSAVATMLRLRAMDAAAQVDFPAHLLFTPLHKHRLRSHSQQCLEHA